MKGVQLLVKLRTKPGKLENLYLSSEFSSFRPNTYAAWWWTWWKQYQNLHNKIINYAEKINQLRTVTGKSHFSVTF